MALKSLSSIESGGTVSGSNTVNNTQKINSVTIGTGDIVIDAEKIPMGSSDSTSVSAKITNIDNAAVHKAGDETITGTKTFTSTTKYSNGIKIECDDGTSYDIRKGGNDGNELIIIKNSQQSDGNNTILTVNASSVKIGSDEINQVVLGYDVEDTSNSKEVATTKWVSDNAVPAGTVISYAGMNTPYGYLPCDGREVSRTQFNKLFAAIDTTFGVGDGSTTFNLPQIADNRFIEYVSVDEFNSKIDSTTGIIADKGLKGAGLPNITGELKGPGAVQSATGAFSASEVTGSYSDDSPDVLTPHIIFNASDSNPIYGNSETVQPKSITLKAYIKY